MESFGRTLALLLGIIGVVFLPVFSGLTAVRWKQHETVRSMSYAFAEGIIRDKMFFTHKWESFERELSRIGGYRAEVTVYERRRFEDESGGFYLYEKTEVTGDKVLREGCLVRVLVTREEPPRGGLFFGLDYGAVVAGGMVQ